MCWQTKGCYGYDKLRQQQATINELVTYLLAASLFLAFYIWTLNKAQIESTQYGNNGNKS